MASSKIQCVDDGAYTAAASAQAGAALTEAIVWGAVQLALMSAQRSSRSAISDMQARLADRRMVIAEQILAQAQLTWAKERALVSETMALPLNTPQYTEVPIVVSEVDRIEGLLGGVVDAHLALLGQTVSACDDNRMRQAMATGRTDFVAHTLRMAEARALQLNDRRYSRQVSVIALGRGKLQEAAGLGSLAGAQQGVRNSLLRTINSGMELWGYASRRNWGGTASYSNRAQELVRATVGGTPEAWRPDTTPVVNVALGGDNPLYDPASLPVSPGAALPPLTEGE